MPKDKPKYQQVILSAAIAIVLVAFVMYGISAFYQNPLYDVYCEPERLAPGFENKEQCEAIGGLWQPQPEQPCPVGQKCPKGWCDAHFTCRKQYEAVNRTYERNVFLIVATLGLAALLAGLALQLAVVSAGISIGGVVLIFIAVVRYWAEFGEYVRLLLLGILLGILIYVAYRKFGRKS